MRSLTYEWRDLAEGYLRARALEQDLRAEWGERFGEARARQRETELHRYRRRGSAALAVAGVLVVVLAEWALFIWLFLPGGNVVVAYAFGLLVALSTGIYGLLTFWRKPDPILDPLDVVGRWWGTVSRRYPGPRPQGGPHLSYRQYGNAGEHLFLERLCGYLPDDFVALRGPLVAPGLDADAVVAGPSGVWVIEVKHWSGHITCYDGLWQRMRTYRGPGGHLVREMQSIPAFDRQWIMEYVVVKKALPDHPGPPVYGGVVLSHPGVSFVEDGSSEAGLGTPESWTRVMRDTVQKPALDMEARLRVIDCPL